MDDCSNSVHSDSMNESSHSSSQVYSQNAHKNLEYDDCSNNLHKSGQSSNTCNTK